MKKESIYNLQTHVFVNFSNHPSTAWSVEQLKGAAKLAQGGIVDICFPSVDSLKDEIYIEELALDYVKAICKYEPDVVMCQGEFGLTYHVVKLLKERCIHVVYTCSERITDETRTHDGTVKTSRFKFVRFRDY